MSVHRVVLAADSLAPLASGIGRVARLVARVLADEVSAGKLEARAITLRAAAPTGVALPTHAVGGSQLAFAGAAQLACLRADAFIFDFAGIARARGRIPGLRRPFMGWMHGIEVWERARAEHLAALRAANVLLCNTRYTLERASALHPGLDHAQVCWLATEQDEADETHDGDAPPTAMIVARMDAAERYKGHRELIAAWPAVVASVPDAQLLIVGDGGDRPALEQLRAASPARARIRFTGFVADRELDVLWKRATLLAMPSRGEGFGLTYIEAMRRGLPVIASRHDAACEVNLDGVTGFNVDLARSDELPGRLVSVLSDRQLARRLGRAGVARWQENFRYSVFRQRFRPHLEALLRLA